MPSKPSKNVLRNQWAIALVLSIVILFAVAAVPATTASATSGGSFFNWLFGGLIGSTGTTGTGTGTSGTGTGGIGGGGGIVVVKGPENNYPACGDFGDNDGDGLTDCNDPDCTGKTCSQQACPQGSAGVITGTCPRPIQGFGMPCGNKVYQCTELNCQDNIDNDQDGKIDGKDYDCPHIDFVAVNASKGKATYLPNGTFTGIEYKITWKNAGTITAPPIFPNPPPQVVYYYVYAYDATNNNIIGMLGPTVPLIAGQTGWAIFTSHANTSKVKVWVDATNVHPEPDENNNIATYNV